MKKQVRLAHSVLRSRFGKDYYYLPYLNGEVTKKRVDKLWQEILKEVSARPTRKFLLIINSTGGDPDAAKDFYCLIRLYGVRLTAVAVGHCCSAANMLLIAGQKRYAVRHTEFLIHGMAVPIDGDMTVEELWKEHAALLFFQESAIAIQAENLKISVRELRKMSKADTYLTAKEAQKIGLVHKII